MSEDSNKLEGREGPIATPSHTSRSVPTYRLTTYKEMEKSMASENQLAVPPQDKTCSSELVST